MKPIRISSLYTTLSKQYVMVQTILKVTFISTRPIIVQTL
jgi:hypothetical protein